MWKKREKEDKKQEGDRDRGRDRDKEIIYIKNYRNQIVLEIK